MSIIGAIFSAIAALLGIPALIARWQGKSAGAAEQRSADQAVTIKEAKDAAKVDTAVARDNHDELVDQLRPFSADP